MKKGNSIRKTLPRLTQLMIAILILLLLPANVFFQLYLDHQQKARSSKQLFEQVKQQMELNEADLQEEREVHSRVCIQKAEMAAYFVSFAPSVRSDLEETQTLAQKLEVDEIHFFTPEGELFAGTHPKYYHYTLSSGEQMSFFLPMLSDKSMQLCQEITPNTAEGREMQYAAVWLRDGSGIVQIGMCPGRLLENMQKKSLQQLISAIPFDEQDHLHIVDTEKQQIAASSKEQFVGRRLDELCLTTQSAIFPAKNLHVRCAGERFCIYSQQSGPYLLVHAYLSRHVVYHVMVSTLLLLSYILFAAIGVIGIIVWYINQHISKNLTKLNEELKKVEEGNLNGIVLNTGILEFDELISEINQILKSIELSWGRVSYLIDSSGLPLGVFEYNKFYNKSYVNSWMLRFLDMEDRAGTSPSALQQQLFCRLEQLEQSGYADPKEEIYACRRKDDTIYLRLRKHQDEQSTTYYAMDVSSWWNKLHTLWDESSRDKLTGLYNRRGMTQKLDQLFSDGHTLGQAALVMVDGDGLKRINDVYGHQVGDQYLMAIGQVLTGISEEHSICVRLGGDEFLLLLYGYSAQQQIDECLAQIRAMRGSDFCCAQLVHAEKLEFSMGWAYYPADGEDYSLLMRLADERMYQDKNARKLSPPSSGPWSAHQENTLVQPQSEDER